jgi:hypothetical protein
LISNNICKMLTSQQVMDHHASPYNPQTNAYAERAGGVLLHICSERDLWMVVFLPNSGQS